MTTPTMPGPVSRAIDAANAGDVDAFLDTFGDGGTVDDWGRQFTGREAIRGWSDREFIGKQVTLDVTDVQQTGVVVVVSAEVGGSGFNGPSHFAFTVNGESLSLMQITA